MNCFKAQDRNINTAQEEITRRYFLVVWTNFKYNILQLFGWEQMFLLFFILTVLMSLIVVWTSFLNSRSYFLFQRLGAYVISFILVIDFDRLICMWKVGFRFCSVSYFKSNFLLFDQFCSKLHFLHGCRFIPIGCSLEIDIRVVTWPFSSPFYVLNCKDVYIAMLYIAIIITRRLYSACPTSDSLRLQRKHTKMQK